MEKLFIPLIGWSDYHLHQFRKGDDLYVPAYQSDDNDMDDFFGCRQHASEEYMIADILREKSKTIIFEYEFWR